MSKLSAIRRSPKRANRIRQNPLLRTRESNGPDTDSLHHGTTLTRAIVASASGERRRDSQAARYGFRVEVGRGDSQGDAKTVDVTADCPGIIRSFHKLGALKCGRLTDRA